MLAALKGFLSAELASSNRQDELWKRPILQAPISKPNVEVELPFVDNQKREVINCCGGNYLGLARTKNGLDTSVGGSPLISGHSNVHEELEKTIAEIYGGWPVVFLNVTLAVQGLMQAITRPLYKVTKGKIIEMILYDQLNHSCLMEALRIADVSYRRPYRHQDMKHLEQLLKKYSNHRMIILTDGVFSMEGDIAPLDKICALAQRYGAVVIVDDAHATGVLGENGKGTAEYFGLEGTKKPIEIISFSKALAGIGAAIIVDEELASFLRKNCRNYIFCGALSPANAAMTNQRLKIAYNEPIHRKTLLANSRYLRERLSNVGFIVSGETNIIPIHIGDNDKAQNMCRDLFVEFGIYCRAIEYPIVPEAILRFTLMATHTEAQIDEIIKSLIILGRRFRVI